MGSMNKAIIVGNLGRDAELRFTAGGEPVANFTLATTETFKGRDGQQREETQWHNVVVWGKTAEALQQYLTKGKQVLVEGKIQTREWTDKEGVKRKTTEIKADRIVLLGGGNGERGTRPARRQDDVDAVDPGPVAVEAPDDSDIPF